MCVWREIYSKCHPKRKTSVHHAIDGISGIRLRFRFFGRFSRDDARFKGLAFMVEEFFSKRKNRFRITNITFLF